MASFVNSNLGSDSDSGDDQDFDPTKESGHVVSEEENSGDDEDAESGTKKSKKSKKKSKQGGNVLSRPAKRNKFYTEVASHVGSPHHSEYRFWGSQFSKKNCRVNKEICGFNFRKKYIFFCTILPSGVVGLIVLATCLFF